MSQNAYVQYGCGFCAPAGWRNFDASPTLRFERVPVLGRLYCLNSQRFPANVEYGDIVKGLPVPAGSCHAVYCSHVLEHLALEDLRLALRNTLCILRDGGMFRLVVPDLEVAIQHYLQDSSPAACYQFLRATGLGQERRRRGVAGRVVSCFTNAPHLWMWDYRSLEQELRAAGFRQVRRAYFADGSDPKFAEVEMRERWTDCCGIECRA